ncbi:MAG TPA: 2-dehydropantoate 2-reductase [Candidatus Bathyarchaeia archaeon]|nr:2-dehydropantoate 2-reductase [Candidatus Bathyarchaeia archaeon]
MQFAIVGAGAVGCFLGSRLQASGQEVLLIHHNKSVVARIRRNGVFVREQSGEISRQQMAVKQSLSTNDDPDFVILTVKAFDTDEAARSQLKSVELNTTVLTIQNGLGNTETLRRYLPPRSIIAGSTTEGVTRIAPGVVNYSGTGTTWIGELDGRLTQRCSIIQAILVESGLEANVSKNILGVLWLKAIVNSAINPISAIAHANNVELLEAPDLLNACNRVVREGMKIATANGILLPASPTSVLKRVLTSTAANKSSMLQDIEGGRQTEIRQLNGVLSQAAKKLGLPAPNNLLLTRLILGLEALRHRV